MCEITYARVQGRDALVRHFQATRFPEGSPEFSPLVFPGEGAAPLTIQQYLASLEQGGQQGAEGGEGGEGAGAAAAPDGAAPQGDA